MLVVTTRAHCDAAEITGPGRKRDCFASITVPGGSGQPYVYLWERDWTNKTIDGKIYTFCPDHPAEGLTKNSMEA